MSKEISPVMDIRREECRPVFPNIVTAKFQTEHPDEKGTLGHEGLLRVAVTLEVAVIPGRRGQWPCLQSKVGCQAAN